MSNANAGTGLRVHVPAPALSGPSSRFWVVTALPSRLSLPAYPLGLADTCRGHLPTRVVRRNLAIKGMQAHARRLRQLRLAPPGKVKADGAAPAASATAGSFPALAADDPSLAAHYNKYGFVIVKGLLDPAEARSVLAASLKLIENAPAERGGEVDALGRACQHPGAYSFTDPVLADDARTYLVPGQGHVLNRISSPMPMAPPFRHVYGNPKMLSAVELIYGSDFCPFAESLVLKNPRDGAGFTFHQDALRCNPHSFWPNDWVLARFWTEFGLCFRIRDGPFEQGQDRELGMYANCSTAFILQ